MSQVLGRVIGRELDGPRGPDVAHRVRVPQGWIDDAAVIEVELPRHLHCAVCEGGGCDLCGRSGAHTLRSRGEPAEIVEVTLPHQRRDQDSAPGSAFAPAPRSFVIRIPELGGLPPEGSALPRGHLLLTVAPAATPDSGVKLVQHAPIIERGERGESAAMAVPSHPRKLADWQLVLAVLLAVVLWIALLVYLRVTGLG
jgi:hypothetical protein